MATVWLADSRCVDDSALAGFLACLSAPERQRYSHFVRPRRQRQFLLGRVLLRQQLGRLLGVAPAAVELVEQPGDAPRLAMRGANEVGFSLSHSGPWIACAVSADTALGLDIEIIDATRDLPALAAHAFDREQLRWLNAQPEAARVRDFFRLWSAEEARFKLHAVAAQCHQLAHPELAIALCSARPLCAPPALMLSTLMPDPVPDAR